MLRRCAVVIRLHLRRCAAAPLRRCLVAVAPLRCCAAAPLFGCSCAGALLRRCGVVRFHLRRCAAAPLRRCVVAVAPVRCCAVAVSSGCSCAWFCACIPGCATGCYLRTVGLLGSDTCNCVFFTLALPVASIGGLMIFHNYYWLFIVWVLLDVDLNNVNCWNLHFFWHHAMQPTPQQMENSSAASFLDACHLWRISDKVWHLSGYWNFEAVPFGNRFVPL